MAYTEKEILDELNSFDELEDIYIKPMINYRGKTMDTKEKFTEVIAKEIFYNCDKFNFNNIQIIKRNMSYNVDTHDGKCNEDSNRREELIAKKMFNKVYSNLGKVIDYQVPIKDKSDTKAGKIDLISYDKQKKMLYLVELKNDVSKETLLRCVLEIMTYVNQIDVDKLKKDYCLDIDTKIIPAILIFEETRPYQDINDEYVKKLIDRFGISLFIAKVGDEFLIGLD